MRSLCKALLASLPAIGWALSVPAQSRLPERPAPSATNQQGTLTGKERLGRKWMDEQRIDNCNVPPDKRGTKPRSATCRRVPTG